MPRCPAAIQDDVGYTTSGTGSLIAPLVPKYLGTCVMGLWIPNFHFCTGGNNAYNSKPQRIK